MSDLADVWLKGTYTKAHPYKNVDHIHTLHQPAAVITPQPYTLRPPWLLIPRTHTHVHARLHIHTHARTHTHIHTYTCTCTSTSTHTHTYKCVILTCTSHFSTAPLAFTVSTVTLNGTCSPSTLFMAVMTSSSLKSKLSMAPKHFLRWGCTRVGSCDWFWARTQIKTLQIWNIY